MEEQKDISLHTHRCRERRCPLLLKGYGFEVNSHQTGPDI